ncbi:MULTISPECIES: acyloxyacyl hydrolase [unclassified Flavobacterium]|uniref:acyloxyacyl hydrolase n=1 Tax=unclassified Flavobacterium TaxID=196869 RepID=UPI001E4A99C9|nr:MULTISPECIES: acyloxyacyl hydrolase [unclassified Flavobacterium]
MMYNKIIGFFFCAYALSFACNAQQTPSDIKLGFLVGFGSEFKNRNYTYSNQYFKFQFVKTVKSTNRFSYDLVLQPEFNSGTHQLLNLYFVKPDEENYIEKRERYTKLKTCNEYILNIGLLMRYPLSKKLSLYVLGSVGPMYIDTATERLSKGFAFADVLALGVNYEMGQFILDFRPNLRHTSNAGLQDNNAGFNTSNIEIGVLFVPKKSVKSILK